LKGRSKEKGKMMWIWRINGKGGMISGSKSKASGLFESPKKSKLGSNGYDDDEDDDKWLVQRQAWLKKIIYV
jgi:hypothetical protein